MGEIAFLSGGSWSMAMRTVRETRVIEVLRDAMLKLMSEVPEMSDIVITVLAARRRRQLDERDSSLVLIGEDVARDVHQIAEFASRNRIPYLSLALGSEQAALTASSCSIAASEPAVIFGRDHVVTDPTPDKIAFVDQLSDTGIKAIQFASFVSPKWVPQMADSDAWVDGIKKVPGVEYTGLWLNLQGLDRALSHRDKLTITPGFSLNASETFSKKNTNRTVAEKLDEMPGYVAKFRELGFDKLDIGVAVAFGCNYEGAISAERVMSLLKDQETRAKDLGMKIGEVTLYDTMGWGNRNIYLSICAFLLDLVVLCCAVLCCSLLFRLFCVTSNLTQ
jgi:hypothetical protein